MRRALCLAPLIALVSIAAATSPAAQESGQATKLAVPSEPDFSGRWILVRPDGAAADVARTLTVQQPIVRTNVHGAPMGPAFLRITIERRFAASTRTDTHLIGVRGGAVDLGQTSGQNRSTSHFVRWEDNRLVMDTGSSSGGRTEVWEFDATGMLIVSVTERATGADSKTTAATYRRN